MRKVSGTDRLLTLGLVVLLGMMWGCGPSEEEPGEERAQAPRAAADAPDSPASAVDLVRYAPADSMMVMTAPSLAGLEDRMVAFSKRLAPAEIPIDEMLTQWTMQWASEIGAPPATKPSEVLRGLGMDASEAVALYVDGSAFADRLVAAVESEQAKRAPAEEQNGNTGETDEDTGAAVTGDEIPVPLKLAGPPALTMALNVSDPDTVVRQLETLLKESPKWASFEKREEEASGMTLVVYDPQYCAYFFYGKTLFVSNDLDWLKQVASRVAEPGPVPEALSEELTGDEQLITLVWMDRLEPVMYGMTMANTLQPGPAGAVAEMQIGAWEESKALYAGEDPLVGTLRWNDRLIGLDFRLNLEKHPAIREAAGSGSPMRLANVLPAGTLAMFSVKLSPEVKASIRKYWIDSVPPEVLQDPDVANQMIVVNQVLGTIEDEVTIGITGFSNNMPSGMIMIGLVDPESVMPQLNLLAMMAGGGMLEPPSEPGDVVEITIGETVTLYYTLLDKTLLVGTQREDLEQAVANLKASQPSGYFASLVPPLDEKMPRFFALSVKPEVVEKSMAMGGGGSMTDGVFWQNAAKVIRELRVTQEVEGDWMTQDIAIHLTEPDAGT